MIINSFVEKSKAWYEVTFFSIHDSLLEPQLSLVQQMWPHLDQHNIIALKHSLINLFYAVWPAKNHFFYAKNIWVAVITKHHILIYHYCVVGSSVYFRSFCEAGELIE